MNVYRAGRKLVGYYQQIRWSAVLYTFKAVQS